MTVALDDTIVAIATAPGEAAIGVVRLSGPRSLPLLEVVLRPSRTGPWRGRQLRYGHLVNPSTGADVDEVMAVYLPPPATYTREATAEIYCHGGHLPAREVLRVLVQAGARIAEPGEFTLRAFVNGRIDLAQAEAVVAAVRSRTREGLQVAMAQLGGKLSGRVARVRRRVLGALAHLEASLDFPEDEVPPVAIEPDLALADEELSTLLAEAEAGLMLQDGLRVAIVGRPNVGKSSLLNALLRQDRAIVAPRPGTTRDTVEETVNLGGIPLRLVDTAGLAETIDPVESLGMARTRRALESADGLLAVFDASTALTEDDGVVAADVLQAAGATSRPWVVVVLNKVDRPAAFAAGQLATLTGDLPMVHTVATEPGGVANLERYLQQRLGTETWTGGELPSVSSVRHQDALLRAGAHVAAARGGIGEGLTADIVAVDLHAALNALGEITGETVDDEVLHRIFSDFCIGK